jgi:glycosyltransferase involved in cell wall biosynthesis
MLGDEDGYAPCLADCRRRAKMIGLQSGGRKRVLVHDLPREEVVAAYHAADVFLLTSSIECSPLVLFEAAASGTPFVSLAVGNAAEIASWTEAGVIVATDYSADGFARADPDAVAEAVDELLADPARRARLAAAGRRAWRERFRWDVIAPHYEGLYAELVAEHAPVKQ